MTAMLRHVVEETLAGRQDYLREYNLGLEVFERSASFDPQTSPIVRVQASKLRRTLALYYSEEGRDDPLRIDLPKGCYVPVWKPQPAQRDLRDAIDAPLSPPDAVTPAEPERRQLTVLRCQLVDSAELTERLGVEGAFEAVQLYQAVANEVVQKYRGQLTHLGEGLVAYFGYPQADEDDAHRSVRAGLELVARVGALRPAKDIALRVQVGIATGLVVAGDTTGGGGIGMDTVVGDAPILATGLQVLAEPNQVIIGPRTYHLAGHAFMCAELGAHRIGGCSEAVYAWHVQGLKAHEGRFEAAHTAPLAPIRGRDQEMDLLLERWRQVRGGEGQVVLLEGEAGIGKSRIVRALTELLSDKPSFVLRCQCSPYHANTALYPAINWLERAARFAPDTSAQDRLGKLESILKITRRPLENELPPIADLLSLPSDDRYPPLPGSTEQHRQQLLNALLAQLLGLARIRPVLLVLEDAHWLDPTTLELANMVIEGAQDDRLMLLITHRPDFQARWNGYPHVTQLSLNRLARQHSSAVVRDVAAGKALPEEVEEQILRKTDGVPLFVEELTKTILDSAALEEQTDHYRLAGPLPSLTIPDTLRDSLMARLDRLSPVKEVAQTAAAIGREFEYRFLQALSTESDESLQQALLQLQDAGMVFRRRVAPEPTYAFKHALVQDTAYQSLLSRKRRQLHARIAEVIRTEFPERLDAEPELMAHHATEAGLTETAIECWETAGRRAVHRSANAEAAHHYSRAIELLSEFTDCAQRTRDELRLLLALGSVEMSRKGYAAPETERIYLRARELCGQLKNPPELAWALQGAFLCHFIRGDLKSGREIAVEIDDLARQSGDSACRVCAVVLLGDIELFSGSMMAGRTRYEE
ncbi:MAG: AAA family ATPase, partial [Gammaproteobacteria bacterium]|nr:AAA family ATPase [Gammaproteobacteria bacterium]